MASSLHRRTIEPSFKGEREPMLEWKAPILTLLISLAAIADQLFAGTYNWNW
jgi:hypothetical protein